MLTVTILGCGSSGGVPRVGQGWGACDPNNPRNRRRRCSILVERDGPNGRTSVLVDTGPDLREQLLSVGIRRLDGVLYTHDHADHVHGIDDLRPLVIQMRRRIDCYADAATRETLAQRFGYCFTAPPGSEYPPILNLKPLALVDPLTIEGPGGPIVATAFPVIHGAPYQALGFRFNAFVYIPDINELTDTAKEYLKDCDVLVIDALRVTRHPTHFNVDQALDVIQRFAPRRSVLTNLHNDLDYATLAGRLPSAVEPAYDGMVLEGL